jgi:hypothetical protein
VHLVMTTLVLVAGLFVALAGDASSEMRLFGWFLVAVGVFGLAVAVLARRRNRS